MDEPNDGFPPSGHREDVAVQRLVGFPASIRRLEDGDIVLEGTPEQPLPTLEPGEQIRVTRAVPGDATYTQPARVLEVDARGDGQARVRLGGEPERRQQRRFVRAPARDVHVVLVEPNSGNRAAGELLNVSAGGIRTALQIEDVHVGMRFRIEFELPPLLGAPLAVSLDGEVVRAGRLPDGRRAVGVRFFDADERTEARLTRWVYRQESQGSR